MLVRVTCLLVGPDTSWLNAINVLLGAAAILCILLVAIAVIGELASRRSRPEGHLSRRLRSISLRQLGFGSTDSRQLPDEKDLHPGKIPDGKSESSIHTL